MVFFFLIVVKIRILFARMALLIDNGKVLFLSVFQSTFRNKINFDDKTRLSNSYGFV
jgi:hypothetical protein